MQKLSVGPRCCRCNLARISSLPRFSFSHVSWFKFWVLDTNVWYCLLITVNISPKMMRVTTQEISENTNSRRHQLFEHVWRICCIQLLVSSLSSTYDLILAILPILTRGCWSWLTGRRKVLGQVTSSRKNAVSLTIPLKVSTILGFKI